MSAINIETEFSHNMLCTTRSNVLRQNHAAKSRRLRDLISSDSKISDLKIDEQSETSALRFTEKRQTEENPRGPPTGGPAAK
jgi:hypothetical protein